MVLDGKSSDTNLLQAGGRGGNLFEAMAFDNGVPGHSGSVFGRGGGKKEDDSESGIFEEAECRDQRRSGGKKEWD